jgi:hypothetical protein
MPQGQLRLREPFVRVLGVSDSAVRLSSLSTRKLVRYQRPHSCYRKRTVGGSVALTQNECHPIQALTPFQVAAFVVRNNYVHIYTKMMDSMMQ